MLHNSKQKQLRSMVARLLRLGYTKEEAVFKANYVYSMRT